MTSDTNNNVPTNNQIVKPSGGFRRRMRLAYKNWQRSRTISALKAVNPRWLEDAGINRDEIEAMVDAAMQQGNPVQSKIDPTIGIDGSRQEAA